MLGLDPWAALLVGAALAPTDAALGASVMSNPRVPATVRRALNVESGLNDGARHKASQVIPAPNLSMFCIASRAPVRDSSDPSCHRVDDRLNDGQEDPPDPTPWSVRPPQVRRE